jgi:hypothetical protein
LAQSKKAENNRELEELRVKATNLGIDFPKNIGVLSLQKKIEEAEEEKEASKKRKPKKLTDTQVQKMKATSLSKVKIMNMNKDNASATTVFTGVHNMKFDLARVVPLNMEIALEEALIKDIEQRKMMIPEPILDKNGKPTGNFRLVEAPEYAVVRY